MEVNSRLNFDDMLPITLSYTFNMIYPAEDQELLCYTSGNSWLNMAQIWSKNGPDMVMN